MMHAGADVDWDSVMHAAFDAHLGGPVEEFQLAFVGGVVEVGAGGAEVVVRDDLQDVRGAEFADSAVAAVEWVMVGLEVFNSAQGARTSRRRSVAGRGGARRFSFGVGGCIADSLDTHVGQWGVEVVEAGVGPIILLELSHMLG